MIRLITGKDILENLLSLRFLLSFLLIVTLFTVSGFVFIGKYRQQSSDYWERMNKNTSDFRERSRQLYKLAFYQQEVYRRPQPLTVCADGFEGTLPDSVRFDMFSSELPGIRGRGNFMLPYFSSIDWAFIVSLILSFVALVFSYDCICGEREVGTLRLMLSGSVPRFQILAAKYLGVMITIGVPLLLGLLVNLIIVVSSKDVALGAGAWLKILALVVLSFLYLSVFVLLGLSVSSRVAYAAHSMVILLLVWVVLVVLVPSFGRILAEVSTHTPTAVELERKLTEVSGGMWKNAEQLFGKNAGSMSTDRNWEGNNPPARARLKTAVTNAANALREDHHNRMLAQAFTGRNFTRLSPVVLYQRASEIIAGTGINHCINLCRQVREYQAELKEYVRSKDQEDPNSMHMIFPEEGCAYCWETISHKPVDFDTVPKFQERDVALGESLRLAVWDIGLLAALNMVFFATAFVSFVRYDAR